MLDAGVSTLESAVRMEFMCGSQTEENMNVGTESVMRDVRLNTHHNTKQHMMGITQGSFMTLQAATIC